MGTNAVKGIITFALGGLVFVIDLFFTSRAASLGNILNGFALAFIGFLVVGIGLLALMQYARN